MQYNSKYRNKSLTLGQLTFNKDAKTIQWGKKFFQQIMLGQLDIHMQNNEFGPPLHNIKVTLRHITYFKRRTKDLNRHFFKRYGS